MVKDHSDSYMGMDLKEHLDFISWLRMLQLLLPVRQVIAISKYKYLGWNRNSNPIPTIPLADYLATVLYGPVFLEH